VDLRGDLAPERRWIEAIDPLDRRDAATEAGPEGVAPRTDRGDRADPGDPDAAVVVHDGRFVVGACSDWVPATASAMAWNERSVRPAIGRVKPLSMKAAQAGMRGRKTCSISTRDAPAPRSSIRQVT